MHGFVFVAYYYYSCSFGFVAWKQSIRVHVLRGFESKCGTFRAWRCVTPEAVSAKEDGSRRGYYCHGHKGRLVAGLYEAYHMVTDTPIS